MTPRVRYPGMGLVARIDALLPQTQCTRCGYPSCRDYARAVAERTADINRCPPGGEYTLLLLSAVTGRPVRPLDPACGGQQPRRVAEIDEDWCIGCTLCIQACPVDAIVGGAKRMHAVIERLCTGCELCLSPCPVDCIAMCAPSSGPVSAQHWLAGRAGAARRHFESRRLRLGGGKRGGVRREAEPTSADTRRAVIAAAVERARARRARNQPR